MTAGRSRSGWRKSCRARPVQDVFFEIRQVFLEEMSGDAGRGGKIIDIAGARGLSRRRRAAGKTEVIRSCSKVSCSRWR
jgi:hypothetical protein